jgi:hypothetical protein
LGGGKLVADCHTGEGGLGGEAGRRALPGAGEWRVADTVVAGIVELAYSSPNLLWGCCLCTCAACKPRGVPPRSALTLCCAIGGSAAIAMPERPMRNGSSGFVDEQLSVTVTSCMSRRKLVSREETTTRTQHNNNSNNNNNSNSNSSINCEQQHKPQQHRAPLAFL